LDPGGSSVSFGTEADLWRSRGAGLDCKLGKLRRGERWRLRLSILRGGLEVQRGKGRGFFFKLKTAIAGAREGHGGDGLTLASPFQSPHYGTDLDYYSQEDRRRSVGVSSEGIDILSFNLVGAVFCSNSSY
jgi:hypothetical protein